MPEDFPSRNTPASPDPLLDEALEWLIQIHSGHPSDDIQKECDAWRLRSQAHERAYQAAEALWEDVGHIPPIPPSARPLPDSRRTLRATAWALAACLVLFTGLFFMDSLEVWMKAATADYHTGVGEQRMVRLEDGSTIQLNTDTAVNVAFSHDKRDIQLIKGEAAFTVRGNPDRPFTVHSQTLHTRALGTIFSVRLHDNHIAVTGLEHSVRVEESEDGRTPVILKEGEQVLFYNGEGLGEIRTVDTNAESSWQRGKLIFEGKPLAEVVDELNRYRRGRIVILNATLRPLKVTGVFDVADPDAALRAIHRTLSIHETALSPYLILLH